MQKNRILHKLLLLLVFAVIVIGACQPGTGPGVPTVTPGEIKPGETESPHISLQQIDNDAPLAPRVIDRRPAGGEMLSIHGDISLVFDQDMNPGATSGALEITDRNGKPVRGSTAWEGDYTLRFQPDSPLETGGLYFVSLDTAAASQNGVTMDEPFGFQFSTASALEISQVFPADGAQDVASDAVITVIFNQPVVPLVAAEEQDDLPIPLSITPQTEGSGEWVNTSVYAFRPKRGLKGGETYRVRINAGLAASGGETTLARDYSWSFSTTNPAIEWFALSNGTYNPQDNADKVPLDEYFTIRFLQPMDRGSTEAALSLEQSTGGMSEFEIDWQQEDMTLVFTPTQRLALNSNYTLRLAPTALATTGGAIVDGITWNFKTVPAPQIVSSNPADGAQQSPFSGNLMVQFASPMRIDTVYSRIIVSPKPENDVQWYYNDWDWNIWGYFLEPSTDYTVRFLPGMEDIYGNRTTAETTIRFSTGSLDPYARLMMPWEPPMLRAGSSAAQEIFLATANVERVTLRLYSLSADRFMGILSGRISGNDFIPNPDDLVWEESQSGSRRLNERTVQKFTLEDESGNSLPSGFYFLGVDAPGVRNEGRFVDFRPLFIANANLTFKTASGSGLVWVTDLDSGEPIDNQPVTVFDSDARQIGAGSTDPSGLLSIDFLQATENYDRFAILDHNGIFGFASSQWGSGMSPLDYGIWIDWFTPANRPTAYIYTERPIYRPDQVVYFKGILRQDNDLDYKLSDAKNVRVKITNYQETVYDEELALNEFGSFSTEFKLDREAELGYYAVEAYLPGWDEAVGSVTFNVSEYRKPEFQVRVEAGPLNLLSGESFTAVVQADYYSGGGVGDAAVDWNLVSEPFTFNPPEEFSSYSFYDIEEDVWGYREDGESGSSVVAEGTGKTDSTGRFSIEVPVDLNEYRTGRRLIFEATVTDVAQTAVSGRSTLVAHKSKVYPGIRPKSYVGKIGEIQTFEIVLLNWDGKPLPTHPLEATIVERRWYSVQEQDATGRVEWKSTVEETPVTGFNDLLTDNEGKAEVAFEPSKGGVYRARVIANDDQGNLGTSSAFLWVAGADYIPWQQTNDRGFRLVTDKKSYHPGETAEILIAAPFEGENYALITVERGRVRSSEVVLLTNNSTIYELPITEDLSPNAFVSVFIVKGIDDTNPRPGFKMGIAQFDVDISQRTVQVDISVEPKTAAPGDQVIYTVQTTDASGNPLPAELSLSLSDLATLSLLPPNSATMLDHFFSKRNLGVWTTATMVNSLEEFNQEIEDEVQEGQGAGGGGGKGDGEMGVIAVRQDFPDTAFWEAHILTGESGEATVRVTLPDNLTTWRMDARAVTLDTRVGQTTTDILSTRPLLVRPQTPRFFVAKDRAVLGAAVHNNTNESLTTTVSLEAEGMVLEGDVDHEITIPAGGQMFVNWRGTVMTGVGRVDLLFRASAHGTISGVLEDASRPPQATLENGGIPVYRYSAPETVSTAGQLLEGGTQVEGIRMPLDKGIDDAELTVRIEPSLAAGITDSLQILENVEFNSVEQTISSFLPNVIATQAMQAADIDTLAETTRLKIKVESALQRLYSWQNSDGGWGWWSSSKSHPLTSAYVVLGLVEAKNAGYSVSETVLERGLNYLRRQTFPLTGLAEPYRINRQAFILYVLARAGKPQVNTSEQLYDQRSRMATYAQAFLVHTLWWIDPDDPRIETMLADLNSDAVVSASGTHWIEDQNDRWNWNTDTRTTAIVLSALSQIDPQNPLNANAARWLMINRNGGSWRGSQETAWSIRALVNWMVASSELDADYEFAAALNGNEISSGSANRDNLRDTHEIRVSLQDILKDELNRLAIARSDGPGTLYYTARLDLSLPAEAIQELDRGIITSRSYFRLDDTGTPVSEAQQGELLLARLTLVAPVDLHYIVVDDPLPAGLEAIDQSLSTSPQSVEVPQQYTFDDLRYRGWGWWLFDRVEYHDEKLVLSAAFLPAGTYVYTYLVRAGTQGDFSVIPVTAREAYFPEVYGRSAGSRFSVKP